MFFPQLQQTIDRVLTTEVPHDRQQVLKGMIDYVQSKVDHKQDVNLNFICTHNSRRSQFSQIWAKTAADYFQLPINSFSGGVEVTAFNERAVESIKRMGFKVESKGEGNPLYSVFHSSDASPIRAFSKVFDDEENDAKEFAAVMTCSHADENCPYIPGTEQRLAVRYEDPKAFDDTPQEAEMYDQRSIQIASEMFYVFGQVKK